MLFGHYARRLPSSLSIFVESLSTFASRIQSHSMHLKLNRINIIHLKPEGRLNNISKYQFLRENILLFSFKVKRLVLFTVKIRLHSQACCLTTEKFALILIIVSSTRMNHCDLQTEWQLTFTSRRLKDAQLPYYCTMYSTSFSNSKQHFILYCLCVNVYCHRVTTQLQ